jgi:iron(III) transport system substrate-binding protein
MFSTRVATAFVLATACAHTPTHAQDGAQVNVICSVQAEWCNMIQTVFAKSTGIKVNMSLKGSGEALAQLIAERANPKTDVWFGGTGDPHLQAAEQGLSLEYKSAMLPQLHPWAQQQAEQSGFKTVGIYSGPLGFGYNIELVAKKKLPLPRSWADLLNPAYKGEIQVANPASSGTAYTMVATLVQLMGEDKAFDYMKALHKNISQYTRSGTGPIKAVARGETSVSISFVHDGPGEAMQGFPVATFTPAEGTGAEMRTTWMRPRSSTTGRCRHKRSSSARRPSSFSCRPTNPRRSTHACLTSRRSSSSTTTTPNTAPAPSAGG